MPRFYFYLKALSTVGLLYFSMTISYYTADAIKFVWRGVNEDIPHLEAYLNFIRNNINEDSDFEDLDTEHFPQSDKGPPPPPYEPHLHTIIEKIFLHIYNGEHCDDDRGRDS